MDNEPGTTGEADQPVEEVEIEDEVIEDEVLFIVPPPVHLGAPSQSLFAKFPLSTA